ncbi:hypothetical protein PVK06_017246 [Gossypium arboreum]|uniref:VWFA domain-containing protein n=1 Tax=Gossypium arboreum TaxID=29729 RepID=A0ABR0Q2P5_GOSAR|nr:hypothetical protein PVK06_017246 [Gossypium arboreum]
MGGKSSKDSSGRAYPTSRSGGSDSWSRYGYPPQSGYPPQTPYYTPQHHHAPPHSSNYGLQTLNRGHKIVKYSRIADNYETLDQVTAALAQAGLESSNLIVGIDFTKSNEWTGARSFNRKSLHHIGNGQNPYEQAISIIGQSLSAFDEDNLIPCYGFGDASTHDQDVFSFYPEERFCNGFEEVLARYREIVPQLRLAGPTSFAPIIEMAMTIVEQSGGQYHVLLIIADGQVTRSVDTQHGQLSPQEQKTIDAIVRASEFPLSIVLVGVGDGPWDMMREFDDNIPARAFDNFQFVNFTEIMSKNTDSSRKQAEFALSALMEIPAQYKATIELGLLGQRKGNTFERVPLPPPMYGASSFNNPKSYSCSSSFQQDPSPYSQSASFKQNPSPYSRSSSFQQNIPPYSGYDTSAATATGPSSSSVYDHQICPICLGNPKDMAFGCGHQMFSFDLRAAPLLMAPQGGLPRDDLIKVLLANKRKNYGMLCVGMR